MTQAIPVSDPNVHAEERARLSQQSRQILAAFLAAADGKVGSEKLTEIAQRFGARIHDLRQAGYVIDIVERDRKSGLTVYQLSKEQQGMPIDPAKALRRKLCAHIDTMGDQGQTVSDLARTFPDIKRADIVTALQVCWAHSALEQRPHVMRGGEQVYFITHGGRALLRKTGEA